jgi:sporulation-control protein spo0M
MIIADPQVAVQAAIYTVLSTNSYIASLGSPAPVFDSVPKDFPVPFVTIGDMTVVDNSTVGIGGCVITLQIHSWDQDLSAIRLKTMMRKVMECLHNQTLTLSDPLSETTFTNVNTRFQSSQVFKDSDGLTLHGVQKFRIVVQNS